MNVQQLVSQLQTALGLSIVTGSITLQLHETELQAVKTETHQRIKPLDKSRTIQAQ